MLIWDLGQRQSADKQKRPADVYLLACLQYHASRKWFSPRISNWECIINVIAMGLVCIMCKFPNTKTWRVISGFVTGYPCVAVMFAVGQPLTPCMLVHFCQIYSKLKSMCNYVISENICSLYVYSAEKRIWYICVCVCVSVCVRARVSDFMTGFPCGVVPLKISHCMLVHTLAKIHSTNCLFF